MPSVRRQLEPSADFLKGRRLLEDVAGDAMARKRERSGETRHARTHDRYCLDSHFWLPIRRP